MAFCGTPILQHKIDISKSTYVKPHKLSRSEYEKVEEWVQEMHKGDIIQCSSSPYNSPIIMVYSEFALIFESWTSSQSLQISTDKPHSCFDEFMGKLSISLAVRSELQWRSSCVLWLIAKVLLPKTSTFTYNMYKQFCRGWKKANGFDCLCQSNLF